VGEYLDLNSNHLVEFSDGYIEVLPMPTMRHQLIAKFLLLVFTDFVDRSGRERTLMAPFRVRLSATKFREPNVLVMLAGHEGRMGNEFWDGADLVVEVVSNDDRPRDLEIKRAEYAQAGIRAFRNTGSSTRSRTPSPSSR
jgi:Uma2 family endonuclease